MAYYGQGRATEPLTNEAHGERTKMSSLNDQLATYIQNVRDMRFADARALGQSHYYESLERMENELISIRNAYEAQMDKMRREVQDTNNQNIALSQALQRDRQKLEQLERRLKEDESVLQKAKGYQGDMRQVMSQRDADIVRLRGELKSREEELSHLRSKNTNLLADADELMKRLAEERKQRMAAENRVAHLQESTTFHEDVHSQKERELYERLKVANGIIQTLDDKLGELAQMTHEQLPNMLKRMRDATTKEMREFHAETEDRLGKTIGALKRQMAEEQRGKNQIEQERQSLQKVTMTQEEIQKDLQGQNQALREQVRALKKELEHERARAQAKAREQENTIKQLEEDLMDKAKEFVHAREAQATLRAEIDTYRSMLDEENSRMRGGKQHPQSDHRPRPQRQYSPPPPKRARTPPRGGGGYRRGETQSVPPQMQTQVKLPPIQGQSNMTGILEPHRQEKYSDPYREKHSAWPSYDTTYTRSFTPKPHDKYGKSYGYP